MKYTICGVSQEMAISLDLDVNDILILNWLHDFFTVSKKKNIDGHIFGWIKYEYLCDEMPLLKIAKKRLGVRLKKLAEKGLIACDCQKKSNGTYVYYRMLEGYHNLKYSEAQPTAPKKAVPTALKRATKDSSIRDSSINKKNYIKKREDENCKDGFIFEDVENSDQNELQGNLSKHSEIEPSFPETKGKSPKADKVIAKADKVMVSRDTKRIDDDLGNAGISLEVWEGYREMRKKMRKPLTDRAEQLAIKKAVSLSVKCGCTPDDIIDQSTMNGWLGLFELKTITTYGVKQNEAIRQNTNPTPAERGREANQRYLEELEQRAIESGYTDEMEPEGGSYGC